jgi:tetratricopeptide (TPR) repeat protein
MAQLPIVADSKALTKGELLREKLAALERLIGKIGFGAGRDALAILPLLDEISALIAEFQAEDVDIRPELGQFESVSDGFRLKASAFLSEIGGPKALQAARETAPHTQAWWWYLDQYEAQRRTGVLKKWLRWLGLGLILLLILVFVYQQFLAPDPALTKRLQLEGAAEGFVQQGDLASALPQVERALADNPQDTSLLIFKGALQQALGQEQEAAATFDQARELIPEADQFYVERAQRYYQMGMLDQVIQDAEAAIELEPSSALGYFWLGAAYDDLGDIPAAQDAYNKASDLAGEQNRPEIVVMIRTRLANMLQRIPTLGP